MRYLILIIFLHCARYFHQKRKQLVYQKLCREEKNYTIGWFATYCILLYILKNAYMSLYRVAQKECNTYDH